MTVIGVTKSAATVNAGMSPSSVAVNHLKTTGPCSAGVAIMKSRVFFISGGLAQGSAASLKE